VDLASRCGSLGGWLRGRPDSHMGIANLKYRLYEIDLIINRTLVYGALTVVLAGLFQAIDGALHYLLVTLAHLHSLPGSIIAALLSTLLHGCCTKAPECVRGQFLCSMSYLRTAGFSSGPAWTRTRDLFLISSTSPITSRIGMSGNLAVLQHFCPRQAFAVSAAYSVVPSRLQYGCSILARVAYHCLRL
jgi:hypothetical protein